MTTSPKQFPIRSGLIAGLALAAVATVASAIVTPAVAGVSQVTNSAVQSAVRDARDRLNQEQRAEPRRLRVVAPNGSIR